MQRDDRTPGADLEAPDTFRLLFAQLWPRLLLALGYTGSARWVAFFRSQGQVRFSDGANHGNGDAGLFLAYWYHRAVAPHLVGAHLGSAEEAARGWLVADTHQHLLYLAAEEEARRHLEQQWPGAQAPQPMDYHTEAELDRLLAAWEARVAPPDPEERRAEAQRERRANERLMRAWLDQRSVESS